MMKKQVQNFESIFKKAKELFDKGNYALAKKNFEKAGKSKGCEYQKYINEKIKICGQEINKLKAKEIIKKARRQVKKNNLQEAVAQFEQAYKLSKEDWIQTRINELKEELIENNAGQAAKDAEASGDYLKASELLGQAFDACQNKNLLIKKARCLVKAKQYEDAVSTFNNLDIDGQGATYDYGFALAKNGTYCKCLKIWEKITSQDENFLAQKKNVASMLEADIYDRFDNAQDVENIYKDGKYLLNSVDYHNSTTNFGDLIKHCKYTWIEQLWKQEHYEDIAELLFDDFSDIEPASAELYAKICFRMAEKSGEHFYLMNLAMFWLTAIYDSKTCEKFSSELAQQDAIRQKLIQMAEDLIQRLTDFEEKISKKALIYWNIEKKTIQTIHAIIKNEKKALFICTPLFAERCGKSSQMLQLIKDNKDSFENDEQFLTICSYYSKAVKSLYELECGDYEKAFISLPEQNDDKFLNYGILKVKFLYETHCLETNLSKKQFETVSALFEIAPWYKKQLIEKALDAHEVNELIYYEKTLAAIYEKNPSKKINEALSLTMTRKAIMLFNQDMMNNKVLAMTLDEALAICPENVLAKDTLDKTIIEIEITQIEKALFKHKMHKACSIVEKSKYEEVKEAFFKFMEYSIDNIDNSELNSKEKVFYLQDVYNHCITLDKSHPFLMDIENKINSLKEKPRTMP